MVLTPAVPKQAHGVNTCLPPARILVPATPQIRGKLARLKLDDGRVWAREEARKARGEGIVSARASGAVDPGRTACGGARHAG
jgi:hypothetical protein